MWGHGDGRRRLVILSPLLRGWEPDQLDETHPERPPKRTASRKAHGPPRTPKDPWNKLHSMIMVNPHKCWSRWDWGSPPKSDRIRFVIGVRLASER